LRSNTKGSGGKTDYTDSQNSDTTASHGRELYHFQFLLQAASLETFGYTLVFSLENLTGRDHLQDLVIDKKMMIMLEYIIGK
jgi:hypothetical protein